MKLFEKRPKISKRTIVITAVLVGVVVIAFLIRGGNRPEEANEEKIKKLISVQEIKTQDQITSSLTVSGVVVPKQYSVIRSLTPGTLEYVVPVGLKISAGEQLFRIRDDNIENSYFNTLQNLQQTTLSAEQRVSQAELALSSAAARLVLAENNFDTAQKQTIQALTNSQDIAIINYKSAYNSLSQFFNLVSIGSIKNIKYKYRDITSSSFQLKEQAKTEYTTAALDFLNLAPTADIQNIDTSLAVMNDVLTTTKIVADSTVLLLQQALGEIEGLDTDKLSINNFQTQINGHIISILSSQNSLRNTLINNTLSLDQSRSQLELAQIEFNNSQVGLDNAKNTANLEKTIIQNQVNNASYNFNNLSLRSPFSGSILSTFAEAGQQVRIGQEIVEVGNLSIIEIEIEVDSEFANGLRHGDAVVINELYDGIISAITPAGRINSGKIGITIQTENSEGFLVASEIADVEFTLIYNQPDLIIIPIKSATIEPANTFVFVLEEGKAVKQTITLGRIFGNKISVTDGLAEGDKLIIRNGVFISEGEEVEIVE